MVERLSEADCRRGWFACPMHRFAVLLGLLFGCATSEKENKDADTGRVSPPIQVDTGETADTGGDICDDVPVVTYANFGSSFITHNCQGCHASTSQNRNGAPQDVIFDSVDEVWGWSDRILERTTGDDPSMPPMGGPDDDERTKLGWWLRCAEEGT